MATIACRLDHDQQTDSATEFNPKRVDSMADPMIGHNPAHNGDQRIWCPHLALAGYTFDLPTHLRAPLLYLRASPLPAEVRISVVTHCWTATWFYFPRHHTHKFSSLPSPLHEKEGEGFSPIPLRSYKPSLPSSPEGCLLPDGPNTFHFLAGSFGVRGRQRSNDL